MKYIIFSIALLLSSLSAVKAQFDEVIYNSEFTYGITTNTNVLLGGLSFKYSSYLNDKVNQHVGFEISNIKHPKEERYTNFYGNSFILYKKSYVFPLRLNYGREFILFRKTPYEGMQMSLNFAVGPTAALVKPYYVLYDFGDREVEAPYDPELFNDPGRIINGGRMFKGLENGEFVMGFHMKNSFAFEFGKLGNDVAGLELGFLLEGYQRNLDIMAFAPNSPVFSTLFLTLFYGTRK